MERGAWQKMKDDDDAGVKKDFIVYYILTMVIQLYVPKPKHRLASMEPFGKSGSKPTDRRIDKRTEPSKK